MVLPREVKTIGRIPVRGSTSLVQPTQTVNQYQVNEQTIQAIEGTPQDISETALLNALLVLRPTAVAIHHSRRR